MRYTLFIDESGSISLNNNEKYFCIGGYLIENGDLKHIYKMKKTNKIISENKDKYFKRKHLSKNEIKFSHLNVDGKNFVYERLKELNGTFVSIVVDKENCTDLTQHNYNDYYNYLVGLLIHYIFDVRNFYDPSKLIELKIIYDNRSMKIEANNDLQTYLIKKFKVFNKKRKYSCNFNIKAEDSQRNYGVMISDYIAGLQWARYNFGEQKYAEDFNINYTSKFPYREFGKEVNKEEEKVLEFV